MHQVCIYYGNETKLLPHPQVPVTVRILLILAKPLAGLVNSLYSDCFYSSPILEEQLQQENTTFAGTVMVNRHGLPAAVKEYKKQPRETI